jgi:hypothetical protein
MHLDVAEVPTGNILERWRKDVVDVGLEGNAAIEDANTKETTEYIHKRIMLKRVLDAAGVERSLDDVGLSEAMKALDMLISINKTPIEGTTGQSRGLLADEDSEPTSCPPRPAKKGRRRNTSLKSYETARKRKNKTMSSYLSSGETSSTDDENPRGKKTRELRELMRGV